MKNKFIMFFLMIAIVTVLVLGIVVFLSVWDSSKYPDSGKIRIIGSFDMESDLYFDPVPGVNTGFVVNPYQAGNSDRERDFALVIGTSVSYILREVKYFTLFIVVLTVLALNAYALIVYFVLDKMVKQRTTTPVKPEEITKTMSNAVMGHINAGKEPDGYIKQTSAMARFSLEIDEMLAEINSVMEKSKLNQKVLLK
jgi:flagellar basal body-associated protein FliL